MDTGAAGKTVLHLDARLVDTGGLCGGGLDTGGCVEARQRIVTSTRNSFVSGGRHIWPLHA